MSFIWLLFWLSLAPLNSISYSHSSWVYVFFSTLSFFFLRWNCLNLIRLLTSLVKNATVIISNHSNQNISLNVIFFWNVFIILLCLAAFILLRNLSKINRLYDMWVCGYIWGCSAVCAFQLIRTIDAWRFICKSFRLIGLTYKWLTFYRIVIENNKREWYEIFCICTRNFSYPHYITRSCGYPYGYESKAWIHISVR